MRTALFWVIAATLVCCIASEEKKIVCYFSNWSVYRPGKGQFNIHHIDPYLCTHLVYSYAGLTIDGQVKSLDPYADLPAGGGKDGYGRFNRLRIRNSQVSTFIAVGGWSESSTVYSAMAADQTKRKAFAENAVKFVKSHGFDGMSFDWQYPNQRGGVPADKENYVKLLKELREEFDRAGLQLMATVGAVYHSADLSYNIPEMVKYLDTINLLTLDFHGPWESRTGVNSPLFPGSNEVGWERLLNVNETLNYWISKGAPANKLVMGIPAYGRTFELVDPKENDVGAPVVGPGNAGPYTQQPGFLGYNEIIELLPGSTKGYNSDQMAWYAYKGNQWFDFEEYSTFSTIRPKVQVIKNLELGGAMLYNIDTDDFLGTSGTTYPLLKAINREIKGYGPPTLSGASDAGSIDPCDLVCREPGYLRDPQDCSIFYRCIPRGLGFERVKFNCHPKLAFDLLTHVCVWPNQAFCNGSCKL